MLAKIKKNGGVSNDINHGNNNPEEDMDDSGEDMDYFNNDFDNIESAE
jgi:hypothetical protein